MSHNRAARKSFAKRAVDVAIHEAFACTGRDRATRLALRQLLAMVQSRSSLLRPLPIAGTRSWEHAAHFTRGILAMAVHHRDWIREPQSWYPPQVSAREVFGSLALHLFATHYVPPFMMNVWFQDASPRVRQRRKWFKHMARGNNIRGTDLPVRLTKKMAYCFTLAPDHYSVDAALRWGEACRMPATKQKGTRCLTTRRRVKRRNGYRNLEHVLGRWEPVPIAGFRHVEPAKHQWSHLAWTIEQIVDRVALVEESEAMHHCVASYAEQCAAGATSIWSMQIHGTLTHHRVVTIEVNPETRAIVQAQGVRNSPVAEKARRVMMMWAERERLVMPEKR